ncbi:related to NADPH-dependent methylglyoxal reductase GRE2 [Saccharomycodes ludwigii]|uniref:Related to NADPH-dependent methylglyoxal reductase GRE2 n=1 Tax=Saccharomycodes ludwigii TaxID=36035 RepID=A0A376B902_9ASCO|nr:hypothetical protein SCDLUD_005273 [Saccharomycodes ludwigii]KAH3898926.1 hypothetical protein SCDLUD_005273 [Saccharomycodes ludwigii]SSD61091.1 related to NADPH-dependent methylglyoxal reductase GRE2 [Saccharomycodes ludwigii]
MSLSNNNKEVVFVSGASGYIAQHIVHQLLETGKYKVIGSVRTQKKADLFKERFKDNKDLSFVIVPDISLLGSFDDCFNKIGHQIDYILHTASPFFFESKDVEKDLLIPAVNGTKSILEATVKYAPQVKKFVVTSSYAAVATFAMDSDSKNIITEKDWNPITWEEALSNGVDAYYASKKFAEKQCWDFLKEHSEEAKFKLTAICPVFVFGEQLFDEDIVPGHKLNTSCEFINALVHSTEKSPVDLTMFGGYISVQDVARGHLECLTNDNLDGKRLILSEARFTFQTIIDIIRKDFPELTNVSKGVPGSDKKRLADVATLDNHVSKELLGFKFKELGEIVDETVNQILRVERKEQN